jgi:hypothetical protein
MAKIKYKFDPHDLSYKKIELSLKQHIVKYVPYFLGSFFMAILLYIAFTYVFDSPRIKQLKRENSEIITQYKLLSIQTDNLEKVLEDLQFRDDNLYRTIFEADPIDKSIREAGIGGVDRYEHLEGYNSSDIVINTSKKIDKITKQMYIQSKSYDEIVSLVKNKDKMMKSIPAIMPVDLKNLANISSYFGMRMHPILKYMRMHTGIDLTAPVGTKVYATGDGIVESTTNSRSGYGNIIVINHGFGYDTFYAHLSKIVVRDRQKVTRGTVIGMVGNSGLSSAPHLHYEVRKKGIPIDPINFFSRDITPEEYDEMIFRSIHEGGQAMD